MAQRISQARVDDRHYSSKVLSARSIIYDKGFSVQSTALDDILKEESLTANHVSWNPLDRPGGSSVISECIFEPLGVSRIHFLQNAGHRHTARVWNRCLEDVFHSPRANPYVLWFIDRQRDGPSVWVFLQGNHCLLTWIQRYRQVPTFGRDTIRKFTENVSEMKKMTAGNFEDLLQVHFA